MDDVRSRNAIVASALALLLAGCGGVPKPAPMRPAPGDLVYFVPQRDRVVALTFDDGPNEPYTSQLLDLLDREGVRATFFLIGTNAERHADTVRRMVKAGHAIGNHSYDHPRFDRLSVDARRAEIHHGAKAIAAITGARPVFFRPPFGIYGPDDEVGVAAAGTTAADRAQRGLAGLCREEGMILAGWAVHGFDWRGYPAAMIAERILGEASPGAILLLHDGYNTDEGYNRTESVKAAGLVIAGLKARGYRFATYPELIAHAAPPLAAFADGTRLLGVGAPETPLAVDGGRVPLRFYWALTPGADASRLTASAALTQAGTTLARADHPMPGGADVWHEVIETEAIVPPGLAQAGAVDLVVGLVNRRAPPWRRHVAVGSELVTRGREVVVPAVVRMAAAAAARREAPAP